VKPVIDRAKKKLDADVEVVQLSDPTTSVTEFEIRYPLVAEEEEKIIKTKSLDSTVDYEKICSKCGSRGVIYRKDMCHSCYVGLERKDQQES
jgi:hypothetical protein